MKKGISHCACHKGNSSNNGADNRREASYPKEEPTPIDTQHSIKQAGECTYSGRNTRSRGKIFKASFVIERHIQGVTSRY